MSVGNEHLANDIEKALVEKGTDGDLMRLSRLWVGGLTLLEHKSRCIVSDIEKREVNSIEKALVPNLTSGDINEHLKGVKLSAEIARILLDFMPKEKESDVWDEIAKALEN